RTALVAGKPGVSSVMSSGGVPVVAMAVPVQVRGVARAIYIGYFRADANPLQTYNERLHYGKSGHAILIDSAGTIVASNNRAQVGTKFGASSVLGKLAAGQTGFAEYNDHGTHMVASYTPDGIAGWS